MNKETNNIRYQRQTLLRELGDSGQEKLLHARVLVIGAGGLGCPALQYLAAAGVGTIGIADDDIVSLHNLHRQPLYQTGDIGLKKVICAARFLCALNPGITIIEHDIRINAANVSEIISQYDIIVDGTDNFSTRYVVNDACSILNKPLVFGAISRYEGQVSVFHAGINPINYRDLFPTPPKVGEVLNCAETGVLGVVPGIIGTIQATETIKLITGIGDPLVGKLFLFDSLSAQSMILHISSTGKHAAAPSTMEELEKINYDVLCGVKNPGEIEEISVEKFDQYRIEQSPLIIDVRENDEVPTVQEFRHVKMPLAKLDALSVDPDIEHIIVFCQTGKRSQMAVEKLQQIFGKAFRISSLKGGILAWKERHTTLQNERS